MFADKSWVHTNSISEHEFLDYCEANQNRATVGTYVFFLQTFNLIISQTSDFSFLELIVGLDVGKAAKVRFHAVLSMIFYPWRIPVLL